MNRVSWILAASLAFLVACAESTPSSTPTDTGKDAGVDAGADLPGADVPAEAAPDAPDVPSADPGQEVPVDVPPADVPTEVHPDVHADVPADVSPDTPADVPPPCLEGWALPEAGIEDPACKPLAMDYEPGNDSDSWAKCISDDGAYHPFDANISTIARIAAFETIRGLLFTGTAPAPEAFVQAKEAYAQDQGLGSRVDRREDVHYAAAPKKCQDMTEEELAQYPDRCVGPAKIRPILNAAFKDGADGKDPILNAARIEAALLWFLYVSVHKEATTCTTTKVDCDSHYAYYTGGDPETGGLGLSRYVKSLSVKTHDRIWDGILAVRCWRDLDNADTATDTAMRDLAILQLDTALLRGVALVTMSRARAVKESPGCPEMQAAWFETVQILGGVLDREATARNAAKAGLLRDELAKGAGADVDAIYGLVEEIFPCP
jgi:hypothetical protein